MVEDMLAARVVIVSHQTVRLWAEKFSRHFANDIRKRSTGRLGDIWHIDEVVLTIAGKKHWLWRAVDQDGFVPSVEHRLHKGLKNRAESSHQPIRRRERIMKRFKAARHLQRFVSIHDPIANLFHIPRHDISSTHHRELRAIAMETWRLIAGLHAA